MNFGRIKDSKDSNFYNSDKLERLTNKLEDDLYPRLNSLIGITSNFKVFYDSWWNDKCLNYKGGRLSDYYDIFFSRFVTFNSLYNTVIYSKERFGLLEMKIGKRNKIIERSDKEKAINLMAKQFSPSDLCLLFQKSEVITNVNKLINIFDSKRFVIIHKSGQQVPEDDLLLLAKLKHKDKRQKILGILELLYNVRCNLFHGSKGYEHEQIELLEPLNEIIFSIVLLLYASFNTMMDRLIEDIEIEIKGLEKISTEVNI